MLGDQLLQELLDLRELGRVDELALLKDLLGEPWDVGVLGERLQLDSLRVFLPLCHDGLTELTEHGRLDLVVHHNGALFMVSLDKARLDLAAHVTRLRLHGRTRPARASLLNDPPAPRY